MSGTRRSCSGTGGEASSICIRTPRARTAVANQIQYRNCSVHTQPVELGPVAEVGSELPFYPQSDSDLALMGGTKCPRRQEPAGRALSALGVQQYQVARGGWAASLVRRRPRYHVA